jgi:hypothetical protein
MPVLGYLSIERSLLHLQLWKFDLVHLFASDVPDLHFSFARPACCIPWLHLQLWNSMPMESN